MEFVVLIHVVRGYPVYTTIRPEVNYELAPSFNLVTYP